MVTEIERNARPYGSRDCIIFADLETLRLQPNGLNKALALFEKEYHRVPAMIGIANSGHNQAIIAEARHRGFTVIHEPKGMLSFEIWMYSEVTSIPRTDKEIATEGSFLATTNFDAIPSCQKSKGYDYVSPSDLPPFLASNKTKGRPKIDAPVLEIKKLGKRGLGAKAIATQLKVKGCLVSFRTVHRILTGERQ